MKITIEARFKNENFREARILAGFMTQRALSELTGISPIAISNYESFVRYPKNKRVIEELERALCCPYDYLFPEEYREAVDRRLGRMISKMIYLKELPEYCEPLWLPSHEDELVKEEEGEHLKEIIKRCLNPREQEVIRLRFGIDNREKLTFGEIGKILGITKERVRQQEIHSLRKLKREFFLEERERREESYLRELEKQIIEEEDING